jgi:hypothetical protein
MKLALSLALLVACCLTQLTVAARKAGPIKFTVRVENISNHLHGVFNAPVGAMAAGPIRPGDSFEYSLTATPGMKLFSTMMFGQSNDWFYSPDANGLLYLIPRAHPSVVTSLTNLSCGTPAPKKMKKSASAPTRDRDRKRRIPALTNMVW